MLDIGEDFDRRFLKTYNGEQAISVLTTLGFQVFVLSIETLILTENEPTKYHFVEKKFSVV